MKKREKEVKEFPPWERKQEYWFRIEFGVKRRPPPSGTCQPFELPNIRSILRIHRAQSLPTRLRFTYTTTSSRFTNVIEHFSNESSDRSLEEDPRWIYILDIVDRTLPAFSVIHFSPATSERWAYDA